MSIVKWRFFAGFTGRQTKWLNSMAEKGYRLVKTGKLDYAFDECEPGKYVYAVEYVSDKSLEEEDLINYYARTCRPWYYAMVMALLVAIICWPNVLRTAIFGSLTILLALPVLLMTLKIQKLKKENKLAE